MTRVCSVFCAVFYAVIVLVLGCSGLVAAPASAEGYSEGLAAKIAEVLPQGSRVTRAERDVASYELLVSAAEKLGRELRATDTVSITGHRVRALWQLPAGAELDRVFAAATQQMMGEELFSCSGRDCGRSTAWANLVFSEALVYGQDRNQRYRVVRKSATEFAAVYAIRRGNRRVNLMLETLMVGEGSAQATSDSPTVVANQADGAEVLSALRQTGAAIVNVVPDAEGNWIEAGVDALKDAAAALVALPGGTVYVVCHMYDNAPTKLVLRKSLECAEAAAAVVEAEYASAVTEISSQSGGAVSRELKVSFEKFAAGPLLPRTGLPQSEEAAGRPLANRIELVWLDRTKGP